MFKPVYSDVPVSDEAANETQKLSDKKQQGVISPMEMSDDVVAFRKGEVQEPAFRDKWFGVAFLVQLTSIVTVACLYARGTLETSAFSDLRRRLVDVGADFESDAGGWDVDVLKLLSTFLISILIAPGVSIFMMAFLKRNAIALIQFSLYFSVGLNLLLGMLVLAMDNSADGGDASGAFVFFFFAVILMCYARAVWNRIPFAASNLRTAITVVQSNMGMAVLALCNIPLVSLWIGSWVYVFTCVMGSPWMKSQETAQAMYDQDGNLLQEEQMTTAGGVAIVGLLLSFYWTMQVLRNVVHTTLAGTVGTWWFSPLEASSCCSRGLTDSLSRSLSYSFGSICLGSLIVAVLEVLRSMLRSSANNRRAGILRCIAMCLLTYLQRIMEYFNSWAFVYVGVYGYSYVEAGKNVFSLFKSRGWSNIISDTLVRRVLGMMMFLVGIVNGLIAALLTWMERASDPSSIALAFVIAFAIGMLLSSLVFRVLISAVDSIIVLFAEAPAEFKENHPDLSHEMESTWTQAWPAIFNPSSTGEAMAVGSEVV